MQRKSFITTTSTPTAHGYLIRPAAVTKNDQDRRAILQEELTEKHIAAVVASEMDLQYDHLNEKVRRWEAKEW